MLDSASPNWRRPPARLPKSSGTRDRPAGRLPKEEADGSADSLEADRDVIADLRLASLPDYISGRIKIGRWCFIASPSPGEGNVVGEGTGVRDHFSKNHRTNSNTTARW